MIVRNIEATPSRRRRTGPGPLASRCRALLLVVPAAVVAALPGCCMEFGRAESARSRAFVADSFARRTSADVTTTSRRVSTLHCALAREWNSSVSELAGTCELVDGRR